MLLLFAQEFLNGDAQCCFKETHIRNTLVCLLVLKKSLKDLSALSMYSTAQSN